MVRRSVNWMMLLFGLAAQAGASQPDYHWWGYEAPPSDADEEPKDPMTEPAMPWLGNERRELPAPPAPGQMMAMHPEDIRRMATAYHEQAVWRPTPTNVTHWLQVRDVVRRKSLAEASVERLVQLRDPHRNINLDYPITAQGRVVRTQLRNDSLENGLSGARGRYGLLLLTEPGCGYCEAQRTILKHFAARYGWETEEIDITRNRRALVKFGVELTPTAVVVKRGSDKWMPVAVGVVSASELARTTYRVIRYLDGATQPEQFLMYDYQGGGAFDPRAGGAQ